MIRCCKALTFTAILAGVLPLSAARASTVVTLTFDDGRQSQYQARAPLLAHGMRGTFFINANGLGTSTSSWHMTLSQMQDLAADGNEIGGHTLDRKNLTTLSYAEQVRQVCDDRTLLLQRGFSPVTSFAYPYGDYNAGVQSVVRSCGYTSARRTGDGTCSSCPVAETLPPLDVFATRAVPSMTSQTTLAQMQQYVTQAEAGGGGWVQLVFHDICTGCDPDGYSVSPSQLSAFLDWLQPRAAAGTVVKTVAEALGAAAPPPPPPPAPPADTTAPTTAIRCNAAACSSSGYRSPVTVSLSATDGTGSGVKVTRYTLDGTTPTPTNGFTYTSPFTASNVTVSYRSWDNAGNAEVTRNQRVKVR